MKIPARLKSIINFITPGSTVADVGTDHAIIPIFLVSQGLSPRVIAGDVNQGPIEAARKNVMEAGLADAISLRLGDGLEILKPGEADTVIIAGMGGGTIAKIMERAGSVGKTINHWILQPMADSGYLREWLADHGWKIAGEDIIREEQRLYEVISAVQGCETTSDRQLINIGPRLFEQKHPLLSELLELQIAKNHDIINSLELSRTEASSARKKELQEKTRNLELIVQCLLNARQ